MNKRRVFYSLLMIILLIIAVAGFIATEKLGNKARQEIITENQAAAVTLSIYVTSTFTNIEGAVKSLAGSPWIAPALLSKREQDVEHANSVLDRYNSAINASVSYLMNADGLTVTSSNRNNPDSFVGKSYHFRPYFQEAAQGQPGRYFALGVTSGNRGFYASYPVQNRLGKVIGVVALKKDLDEMENFFSRYPFCFLISPDGIIFLSSKPAMVLKSIWPLDKTAQEKLLASQQFGNNISAAVFKKEIADGAEATLEGDNYFVSRKVIDRDGWSLVVLTSTERIRNYQLLGILAAISLGLLIIFFSGIIYVTDRSKAAIEQSEESKHLLLQAVAEGIFGVDATGRLTFVNPAALCLLGFSEEEMIGQNAHNLIHHSRQDGSRYPAEDCPMYATYTRATESAVTTEVLWRKDGSSFSVEYSSTPIISNGMVIGAVVTFRDVTERRQAEETLKESESRLRAITDSAQDAILMMDPEGLISYWNPAAERIFGYTRAEALGQNLHSLIVPSRYLEAHHAAFPVFQQTGQGAAVGKTLDLEARRKDGKEISVQLSLAAIQMKGAWHAVGVLRDITERRQAEEALKESDERFRELANSTWEGIFIHKGGIVLDVNKQALIMLGYSDEEVRGKSVLEFIAPESIEPVVQKLKENSDMPVYLVAKGLRKNKTVVPLEVLGRKIKYKNLDARVVAIRDITERKQAEEALRESEELFRSYLENAPDGVYMSDLEGTFLYGNRRCEEIIGYRREELIGKNFLELNILSENSLDKAVQLLQANMEGKPTGPDEIELICKEGRIIPVEINTSVVQRMGQRIILAFVRDITERKQSEEKIRKMAYHDSLTGLPNRKLFSDRLGIALAQAQRNQQRVGVAMLDLDKFKDVNDTLGHNVGDLLLQAVAERLSAALRKGDTVARIGGDEFVLLLPDLKDIENAIQVAQKIVDSFRKPLLIDTHQLVVTMSLGIAVFPGDGIDEDMLLKNADIAMYQAKEAGRSRYQIYKETVNSK